MRSLPEVRGEYRLNYNLSHLTWFKVGGPAEVFFKPADISDLVSFLMQNQGKLPVTIIGAGSNIIIRDGGIEGAVIKLGQNFNNIEFDSDNNLVVGAGCLNFNLAKFCQANAIAGFEFLIGIPGTVGGGIAMNAGAYEREFKDITIAIEVISPQGKIITFLHSEIGFKYRSNDLPEDIVITKVIFRNLQGDKAKIAELMNQINSARSTTQPVKEKTGGSTFANPDYFDHTQQKVYKAWELIDKAGLRGYRIGDASISELHCNFMINHGNATAYDLESLGNTVQQEVLKKFGIRLEWEIKRIGKYA